MRVRYGKPIKAKSLLGNQFSSLTGDSFSTATTVIMFQNQHYYYSWKWGSFKYNFTLPSHKYFFYAKFKNNLTIRHTIVIGTQNDGSITTYDYYNPSSIIISNERYAIFDNTNSAISRLDNIWFYYNSSYSSEKFNSNIDIPEYWILVDLTDIFGSGKEPTREEFYNKYSKYFHLIATGREITIDRKVGQVSYDKKVILQSLWGDQSNLAAVQSSVSGNYIYLGKNGYSVQSTYNINTNLEDFNTPIINGHKYILILYQTGNSVYHMISTTNSDKWKWTSSGTYIVGKLNYSYYVADDDIILKNFYQGDSGTPTLYKDFFIDLTDAFGAGNEPTATEFYNKYKGYFLSLTKGERVIVGKGKIAGGSSDIYYGYNQLAELPETSGTKWRGYNCTMTAENGVATCVANGGKYPALASQFYKTIYELGHIYMHLAKFKQDTAVTSGTFAINTNGMSTKLSGNSTTVVGEWVDLYFFGRGQGASTYQNTFNIQGGTNAVSGATFYVKDCICIDLTDWFGAGKEPATVEEFREKFAKEYYGFCKTPIKLTRYQIEALPTYGYNQYAKNGDLVDPAGWGGHGGSSIAVSDGVATITASASSIANFGISRGIDAMTVGHKIFASCTARITSGSSWVRLRFPALIAGPDLTSDFQVIEKIGTVENTAPGALLWQCVGTGSGAVVQFKNIYIIDLTDWYGAGNEPATIEEFKQTFPNKYYPYSKKRLLNKYMINKLIN